MEHANMFDDVEQLESNRREVLIEFCSNLGLSEDALKGIEEAARLLREFEMYHKKNIKTTKQILENLQNVVALSKNLRSAIEELPYRDRFGISVEIGRISTGFRTEWDGEPENNMAPHIEFSLRHLRNLESAAERGLAFHSKYSQKNGRKSVLHHYYYHIEWVWCSLENEGIALARNGKFERICDAVFLAAGVHSSAEGAVRFFIKNKPSRDADIAALSLLGLPEIGASPPFWPE